LFGGGGYWGREAQAAVAVLRRLMPNYTVARWLQDGKGWSDNAIFLAEFHSASPEVCARWVCRNDRCKTAVANRTLNVRLGSN
jgi:hypothetical protein